MWDMHQPANGSSVDVTLPVFATMESLMGFEHQKSQNSSSSPPRDLWPVDLKLTHLDWDAEATLIHFQGQYLTICELDYNILQGEIQNIPKNKAAVDIGEFCLVEDLTSGCWFRGRVQNRKEDLFDVFLIDHGNVLSVDITHISSCSKDLFILPPKVVCGFLSNVLLLQSCSHSIVEEYFSSLIGRNVTCFIQAIFPHKTLLLEAPDINRDLVRHGFGKHVDTDTFLFLVRLLTEMPLKQHIVLPRDKPRGQEFCLKSSGLQRYIDFLSVFCPRLSSGTQAKVRVTAAFRPGLFYCQMVSVEPNVWQMSKKLAVTCEPRPKEQEILNELCAVKGKDGKWYRGFLQFLPVNSQVRVLFIDYGFFDSVDAENIRRLPSDFYSIPIMAIPCSLSKVSQDPAQRSQQLSFLKAGLLGATLDVEISGFNEEHYVHTITITGAEDKWAEQPKSRHKLLGDQVLDPEEKSPQGDSSSYETMVSRMLGEVLQAEGVQVGSVFDGYVEHVQNPNHFWVTTQKRSCEFKEMMTKMADHFSQVKLDEDTLSKAEPGMMCCALYEEDMHYYRGVVINTLHYGAEVLFIDFGNIAKVPHMVIKNIPEAFANKSAFAICCSLVNAFPVDDFWPSTTCDLFREAVANKALQVHVVQVRKNKLVVDLFEMGSEKSITELVISSELAHYVPMGPAVQNNKDATEGSGSQQATVIRDVGERQEHWEDLEEVEIRCKNETNKVEAPVGFRALTIKPGYRFTVRCSHITSPSDFWCQPLGNAPALEKLMNEVQQYYQANAVPLHPGDSCCIVKSPKDEKWYRGLVIGKQQGHVTVLLVDYGSTIEVGEKNLQAILPEYFGLEVQAFRCSFHSLIEPADLKTSGDWNPEVCNLLKDFALNSTDDLKCKVVSQLNVKNKGLCSVVNLYNTQAQSITSLLVEKGLAREATAVTKQQASVFPESFVYSSFDLNPGNEEQVFVTHVSSQYELYCHLDKNTEIIENLEMKISEEMNKLNVTGAVVQKLCLAKYLDGKWYRAVVLPAPSPLHVSVFFVDYGNATVSEKNKVLFIPRDCVDLLYIPMQAVRFNLHLVPKEELYADVKEWLSGAVLNKLVNAVIQGRKEDGSFDVELFDGKININDQVKKLLHSRAYKPKTPVLAVYGNAETKQRGQHTKNARPAIKWKGPLKGHASAPAANAFRCKENTKKLHLNKNTKVKHQSENTHTSAPAKPPKVKQQRGHENAESKQKRLSQVTETSQGLRFLNKNVYPGFRAKCYVSHIDSVSSFFLQLSEDEPAILKMGDDLNSGVFRESLKVATSLRISDVVLAEYEDDGALYRSLVTSQEDLSSFRVEFVDYGNSGVIGKEKIYSLPEEFQTEPRLSIPCSLLDTGALQNDASFIDALWDRPLMVDFVCQVGIQWQVKVEILDEEGGLEEYPPGLPEKEEKLEPCELNVRENCQNEKAVERTSASECEKFMPNPPPARLSVKPRATPFRCLRQGPIRKKTKKKETSSVKVRRCCKSASSPLTIRARDIENGTILSVQSDGSFYVRLTKTNNLLTVLERCIADNLYKCKPIAKEDIKEGLECLVQVQSNVWQRGVVQAVNGEKLGVLLVDHGIIGNPSDPFRRQCSSLTKIPNLAVLCKTNGLRLREGADPCKSWCETLKPIIGQEVKLVFVCFSEADNLWMVEVEMSGLFLAQQSPTPQQQNEMKIPSPAEAHGETSDSRAPQQLFFAPLDSNKAYSGVAAAVTTPFEFCVVLEDMFLTMTKVSIMLENLPGDMTPLPEAHLAPGNCCLLKSHSESKWCRAEIVHADSTLVLNLVDYGFYECMPYQDFSKLRKLPLELRNLPKLTYPCMLAGVKPVSNDGQWTDEATVFFQQCLYQKNLQICFQEFVSNSHWRVDVLADGVHVAKELMDAGHADCIDESGNQVPARRSGVPIEEGGREWT